MAGRIKLSFSYTFIDRILAEFALLPHSKIKLVIFSLIPGIGVAFFCFVLWKGIPLSAEVWLIVGGLLLLMPALTILGVGINYLTYPATREPFTYEFDEEGIHVVAVTHDFRHKWSAITMVKCTPSRLMFFFGRGVAHCLPMAAVRRAGVLEPLLELAGSQGVKIAP